jgi:hypothetical protein
MWNGHTRDCASEVSSRTIDKRRQFDARGFARISSTYLDPTFLFHHQC